MPFKEEDRLALQRFTSNQQVASAHSDFIWFGQEAAGICFILEGYACQYAVLPNGRRQIVALLLPGDECSSCLSAFAHPGHRIRALTQVTYSEAAPAAALPLLREHPVLAEALWRSTLAKEATLYAWLASLGRRTAKERLAHLLCEVFVRSQRSGLNSGMQCIVPLNQEEIADALGLSLVHTNRSLQALRMDGLVQLESRLLTMLDFPRMKAVAQFDPRYLQVDAHGGDGIVSPGAFATDATASNP